MDEPTPTQEASQEWAEAVFAEAELRDRFEMMAKETFIRESVPDDFAWLSPEAEPQTFSRFKAFTRKLLAVSKPAMDAKRANER